VTIRALTLPPSRALEAGRRRRLSACTLASIERPNPHTASGGRVVGVVEILISIKRRIETGARTWDGPPLSTMYW
jgi:hypothetical protein